MAERILLSCMRQPITDEVLYDLYERGYANLCIEMGDIVPCIGFDDTTVAYIMQASNLDMVSKVAAVLGLVEV